MIDHSDHIELFHSLTEASRLFDHGRMAQGGDMLRMISEKHGLSAGDLIRSWYSFCFAKLG